MLRRRNALSINGARPASYSAAHLNHVEAIAHLEYLVGAGKLKRSTDAQGIIRYARANG